jgi:pimeloyl-ACP methyl ester carboxylesterase
MDIDLREPVQLGDSTQLVWFEHSAHLPHLEEPERFRQLLAQVRLGLPAPR